MRTKMKISREMAYILSLTIIISLASTSVSFARSNDSEYFRDSSSTFSPGYLNAAKHQAEAVRNQHLPRQGLLDKIIARVQNKTDNNVQESVVSKPKPVLQQKQSAHGGNAKAKALAASAEPFTVATANGNTLSVSKNAEDGKLHYTVTDATGNTVLEQGIWTGGYNDYVAISSPTTLVTQDGNTLNVYLNTSDGNLYYSLTGSTGSILSEGAWGGGYNDYVLQDSFTASTGNGNTLTVSGSSYSVSASDGTQLEAGIWNWSYNDYTSVVNNTWLNTGYGNTLQIYQDPSGGGALYALASYSDGILSAGAWSGSFYDYYYTTTIDPEGNLIGAWVQDSSATSVSTTYTYNVVSYNITVDPAYSQGDWVAYDTSTTDFFTTDINPYNTNAPSTYFIQLENSAAAALASPYYDQEFAKGLLDSFGGDSYFLNSMRNVKTIYGASDLTADKLGLAAKSSMDTLLPQLMAQMTPYGKNAYALAVNPALPIEMTDGRINVGAILANIFKNPNEDQKTVLDAIRALMGDIEKIEKDADKQAEAGMKKAQNDLLNAVANILLAQGIPGLFSKGDASNVKAIFSELDAAKGKIMIEYDKSTRPYYDNMIRTLAKNMAILQMKDILSPNVTREELAKMPPSELDKIIEKIRRQEKKSSEEAYILQQEAKYRKDYLDSGKKKLEEDMKGMLNKFTGKINGVLKAAESPKK